MNKNRKFSAALALIFSVSIALVSNSAEQNDAKTLVIAVDDSCPYTCLNFKYKGIFIEALESVLIPQGYTLKYAHRPWKRAISEFNRKEIDILPAAAAISFPQGLGSKETLLDEYVCFYAKRDFSFDYSGLDSLKGVRIGWLQYEHEILPHDPLYEFDKIKEELSLHVIQPTVDGSSKRSLQLLLSGRIDLLLFNRTIMRFQMNHSAYKESLAQLKEVGCL